MEENAVEASSRPFLRPYAAARSNNRGRALGYRTAGDCKLGGAESNGMKPQKRRHHPSPSTLAIATRNNALEVSLRATMATSGYSCTKSPPIEALLCAKCLHRSLLLRVYPLGPSI